MSEWTDLQPATKKAQPSAPVRFGLIKFCGARARGVILIRREVIEAMAMKTWRVRVRVGKGARSHQVSIVHDEMGPFELSEVGKGKGGGVWRVRLPVVEQFPDAADAPFERPYKIEREGKATVLVIDLPAFCFDASARRAFLETRP